MRKFKINVEKEKIQDLMVRIQNTRWVKEPESTMAQTSLDVKVLRELSDYWANVYDWKKQEEYLNSFSQYMTSINDIDIHFLYEKERAIRNIPILFLHGWAGSFTEYLKVVEIFKRENPEIGVVVPSHPGFGFSGIPDTALNSENVATIMHKLMTEVLGYESYYIHGGDFGAFVGEKMAIKYRNSVKGLHLSDIPYYHLYGYNENPSGAENEFLEKINNWSMEDGAYSAIQATKPKILSTALNDSPMGLAAWLLQLYHDFSDKNKTLGEKYDKDDLFTNISVYWFTETIYSSMRIYSEDTHGFGEPVTQKTEVPTGFCFYPFDISGVPPKEYASRFFTNIISWTEPKSGGHFGAMENPSSLHSSLLNFIKLIEK